MKHFNTATATAIALVMAMPAFAGSTDTPVIDAVTSVSAPVDANRWAGPYLGGYVGPAYDDSEVMLGLQIGYNWQHGLFVFGGELDAFTVKQTGEYELFVNARAGVTVGDNAFVFVKAGQGTYQNLFDLTGVGLGAEYAVNDSISIRFDYEFHIDGDLFNAINGPSFTKIGVTWGF